MGYPTTPTIKRLFAVSGNRCAFPDCSQFLIDQTSGKVIGEICHIKARSGGGPRFDSTQANTERNGFGNLVIMCPIHHQIVDADISTYTVERLLEIKQEHESRAVKINEPTDEIAETLLSKILSKIAPPQKNLEYFEQLLKTGHWDQEFISGNEFWICKVDSLCQIEISQDTEDFTEPWTEIYPSKKSWRTPVYLRINNVAVKEVSFVACDGGRILVPMPEVDIEDGNQQVFYWDQNSLTFNLAKIIGKYYIYKDIYGVAKTSKIEIR